MQIYLCPARRGNGRPTQKNHFTANQSNFSTVQKIFFARFLKNRYSLRIFMKVLKPIIPTTALAICPPSFRKAVTRRFSRRWQARPQAKPRASDPKARDPNVLRSFPSPQSNRSPAERAGYKRGETKILGPSQHNQASLGSRVPGASPTPSRDVKSSRLVRSADRGRWREKYSQKLQSVGAGGGSSMRLPGGARSAPGASSHHHPLRLSLVSLVKSLSGRR